MNELRDKTLSFTKRTCESWNDSRDHNCASYQKRYLYVSAFAAYNTAKSYWLLHKEKAFYDCGILARNLLERIVNSAFAGKSAQHAVELIASESTEIIKRLKCLKDDNASIALDDTIKNRESELETILRMVQKKKLTNRTFRQRFDEAGLSGFYPTGFFSLSQYVHPGYELSRPERHNQPSKHSDFIALVAPIHTAVCFHTKNCSDCQPGKCDANDEFRALFDECSSWLGNESIR